MDAEALTLRTLEHIRNGKRVVIIHLGDHDPSGVDMSRDNGDRIRHFLTGDIRRVAVNEWNYQDDWTDDWSWDTAERWMAEALDIADVADGDEELFQLRRIALNMDQIRQFRPPPNPAKLTDSRATGYIDLYGDQSWELDALPPDVIAGLIRDELETIMEPEAFLRARKAEDEYRERIKLLLDRHGSLLDLEAGS